MIPDAHVTVYTPTDGMTLPQLRRQAAEIGARVEARLTAKRGVHEPDSRREQIDEDRLNELEYVISQRARPRKTTTRTAA